MESLVRLQALIRGHLVRQAISQIRSEYEQIADAIESPRTKIIWPDAAFLGKPHFTAASQSSSEKLHSTNASQQRCKIIAQAAVDDIQYSTIPKEPDNLLDSREAECKTAVPHYESTVEAATATLSRREEPAVDRATEPLLSSSPHSNNHRVKEHLSESIVERQTLSLFGVDNSSTIHIGDPMETAQVPSSHLRVEHSLSLCRDDTAFAGGSESDSTMSNNACDNQHEMHPKPIIKEENTDLELWSNCLPFDKVALRAMHGDMLMELLWIEQAISSRVEYLAIKAKIGVQQS